MTMVKKLDDDQCSLICYKDSEENRVGTIRIRQEIQCSACKIVRTTLSLYGKHCQENSHRENVKKLVEKQMFIPSIYDRTIQFALQKNFFYQSENFHFRYKTTRPAEVTLVFQGKSYRRTGVATPQIREELLRDLVKDRAEEFDRLTLEMFYEKKQNLLANSTENKIDPQRDEFRQVLDEILTKIVEKSDEFRREKDFLSATARRHFRKKNTFHCDVCSLFLSSEKFCEQHLHSVEHREKLSNLLPWRDAMQKSLMSGRNFQEIISKDEYDKYKQTMAEFLAPTSLFNRGRFLCAFCQMIFADQWALEKHLHSEKHQQLNKTNHKDFVVKFANSIVLPAVFKFNGVNDVNEVPEDIRIRFQWSPVTRFQLDEDTKTFLRAFPLDRFEGVTQLTSHKPTRKHSKHSARSNKNNRQRSRPFQKTSNINQNLKAKRPMTTHQPVQKRFRPDINPSFAPAPAPPPPPRQRVEIAQYPYNSPGRFSNGSTNHSWPIRPLLDQRHESFERSNFELRSIASNHFHNRPAPPPQHHQHQHYQHHQGHPFPPSMPFNGGVGLRNFNPPPPPLFGAFAGNPSTASNGYSQPQRFPPFNGSSNHFERQWNGSSSYSSIMPNKPFDGPYPNQMRGRSGPPIPNLFHRPL